MLVDHMPGSAEQMDEFGREEVSRLQQGGIHLSYFSRVSVAHCAGQQRTFINVYSCSAARCRLPC
jgi:hypothetical protein